MKFLIFILFRSTTTRVIYLFSGTYAASYLFVRYHRPHIVWPWAVAWFYMMGLLLVVIGIASLLRQWRKEYRRRK